MDLKTDFHDGLGGSHMLWETMYIILLDYVEFEGIKKVFKDKGHCWRFGGHWRFLTVEDVFDHKRDVCFWFQGVYVWNFVKICCVELSYDHFNTDFRLVTGWVGGWVGWSGFGLVKLRYQLWLINLKRIFHNSFINVTVTWNLPRYLQSEAATMCTPGSKISKCSNTHRVNESIILNKKYMINH